MHPHIMLRHVLPHIPIYTQALAYINVYYVLYGYIFIFIHVYVCVMHARAVPCNFSRGPGRAVA